MTSVARREQLTLFIPPLHAEQIETWRQQLDPVQSRLISAHVTLCREDELASLPSDEVVERLASWQAGAIALTFSSPILFGGHGVMLPCVDGQSVFHRLRQWVLGNPAARDAQAHITLAHPRNPRSAANTTELLAQIGESYKNHHTIHCPTVSRIQQIDGGPWRTIYTMTLQSARGTLGDADR